MGASTLPQPGSGRSLRPPPGTLRRVLLKAHLSLFPPACRGCGRLLEPPGAGLDEDAPAVWSGYPFLCRPCHAALPWRDAQDAEVPAPGLDRLAAPFRYAAPVDEWIQRLKYGRRDGLVPMLAALLKDAPGSLPPLEAGTLVVPVPLHPRRLWQRGFNQSLLLAHAWLRRADAAPGAAGRAELTPRVLLRHRYTRPQVRVSGAERHANVAGAFSLHPRLSGAAPLRGRHVVLVDDVTTTGATLSACAQVLRAGGAECVEGIVLARA